jgi:hypothetical protein
VSAPAKHLEILRHMLGVTDTTARDAKPSRDHYAAEPGDPTLASMAEAGLVRLARTKSPIAGGLDIYITTDLGRATAMVSARRLRKPRGARVYSRWLDVADVVNVTFKDFLTRPEWAEVRRNA